MNSVMWKGFWFPKKARQKDYTFSLKRINSLKWIIENWKRNRTVVQAGGSYGVWPAICAEYFDLVYSFEPDWLSFYYLNLNCPFENVIKIQAALSNKNKTVAIRRKGFTSHRISDIGYVPGITVDSLHLLSCDCLLFDVEGYELYTLQGAKHTIREFRPLILVENQPKMAKYHQINPITIALFLDNENYTLIKTIDSDDIYIPGEVSWAKEKK